MDDESHYKSVMNKPLFNTDEDEEGDAATDADVDAEERAEEE